MAFPPPYPGQMPPAYPGLMPPPVQGGVPPLGMPPGYSQFDPRLAPPVVTSTNVAADGFLSASQSQLNNDLAVIHQRNQANQQHWALQQQAAQQALQANMAYSSMLGSPPGTGNPQLDAQLRMQLGQADALAHNVNMGMPPNLQGNTVPNDPSQLIANIQLAQQQGQHHPMESMLPQLQRLQQLHNSGQTIQSDGISQIQQADAERNRAFSAANAKREFDATGQTLDPQVMSKELDKVLQQIQMEYPGTTGDSALNEHQLRHKKEKISMETGMPLQSSENGPRGWFHRSSSSQQS
jgi:hypothetical protein